MADKLRLILNKENFDRFSEENGKYYLDVHGLKVYEAKSLIKNVGAFIEPGNSLIIIHGYIHGTAIKDMLSQKCLFNRKHTVENNVFNQGRTNICFV